MADNDPLASPLTTLPYNIQKEIVRKLKLRPTIALQKTSRFGRDIVELANAPHYQLFKDVQDNRLRNTKDSIKRWTGDPSDISAELGVHFHIQKLIESGLTNVGDQCVLERAARLEKVIKVWMELYRDY